jgi:WD domain, G-beta repeat
MLDKITRKLENSPQTARIKKLLFCACYGRWSKDAAAMSAKELQQCLQMLCDLYPTLVEFKHALYQVVIRLNHSSEYYGVANIVCHELTPFYANMEVPVAAAIDPAAATPEPVEQLTAGIAPAPERAETQDSDLRPRSIHFKIQAPSLQQARMVCEISLEGRKQAQTTVSLPLQIIRDYANWQTAYRRLHSLPQMALAGQGSEPAPAQINECLAATEELVAKLQSWSRECQTIAEQIQRLVPSAAPLKVLVSSDLPALLKLPWNVCFQSWLEDYPQAETVIQLQPAVQPRQVQMTVVLAGAEGIDGHKSQAYLAALPETNCRLLLNSSPAEVLEAIWQTGSVVAISSNISGYGSRERLLVNANDSLPIADLQLALRRAVEHGLKLLIWNSGDGLEMAGILAETGVPYILTTREPLPDRVMNELLKLTMKLMADGKPLAAAVRTARERLQEIERVFPAASWLPLLCQTGQPEQDLVWADLAALPPIEPGVTSEPVLQALPGWAAAIEDPSYLLSAKAPAAALSGDLIDPEVPVTDLPEVQISQQPQPPSSIEIPPHIDYDTMSLDRCLTGYYSEVHGLAISSDGKLIFSGHGDLGCKDNNVKVWLLGSGELLQDLVGHRDAVRAIVADRNNPHQFWSAGADGQLLSWNVTDGRVTPFGAPIEGGVGALLSIGNGRYGLSGSGLGVIQLWDIEKSRLLRSWSAEGSINALAVDAAEQLLVSASEADLILWDLARGRQLHQLRGHSGAVRAVALSAAGDLIISAGVDRTVRIWDVATGNLLQVLVGHERPINCLALTPDGRSIITGSDDKTVKVWRLQDGSLVNSLFGHNSPVVTVAIDKAGQILVTGGYGEIRIWEIE